MALGRPVEIYALSDPGTGEIRYIGKANDSEKRFKGHLRDCRRRKTPVYCWISKLLKENKSPVLSVIETCENWQERERFHIARLRVYGSNLLNLADGGDEPFFSKEIRAANGRKNANAIQSDPKRKRIRDMKMIIASSLRRGGCSEETKAKLRLCAKKRPDLFSCWANI